MDTTDVHAMLEQLAKDLKTKAVQLQLAADHLADKNLSPAACMALLRSLYEKCPLGEISNAISVLIKQEAAKPVVVKPAVVKPAGTSASRFRVPGPAKKWMTCLRCGRRLYTDIYHRLCRRCTMRNTELGGTHGRISSELSSMIRRSGFDDSW